MNNVTLEAGKHSQLPNSNGMDINYWYASVTVHGDVIADASGPTPIDALYGLADNLAKYVEENIVDSEDGPATSNSAPYTLDEIEHLPKNEDPWANG